MPGAMPELAGRVWSGKGMAAGTLTLAAARLDLGTRYMAQGRKARGGVNYGRWTSSIE